MTNQRLIRTILWFSYLIFATICDFYAINFFIDVSKSPDKPSIAVLLMIPFLLISFGIFIFNVLFFKYRARNLFWFLLPVIGAYYFALQALLSKKAPADQRTPEKLWGLLALLGLYLLDQTGGFFFANFAISSKLSPLIITIDLILFALTIAYFIYWGKKRKITDWKLTNLWNNKWKTILTLVLMFGLVTLYAWVMIDLTHLGLPTGDNQESLNTLATNTPPWLMWIHVAIGAAVMEETIFRVGIYEVLLPKHPKIAFFVSAIVFASIHMTNSSIGDWRVWINYLIMGVCLSGLYYKSRKVETSATVHFLWNGVLAYLPF